MQGIEIPESVAIEILSGLPVKSLKRFRCVCKSWACCFQTSYFITKHHRHNLDNNNKSINLLLKRSDYTDANVKAHAYPNVREKITTYFSALSTVGKGIGQNFNFVVAENIHIPNLLSDFQVYGPCNGLLYLKDDSGKSVIWNPSTRQFKTIPEFIIRRCLSEALGFGFDSTTHDYKVVRIVQDESHKTVELYSLTSDCWKEISSDPKTLNSINVIGHQGYNCYINGFYYWPAMVWSPPQHMNIVSFDMANEKLSTLPWPNVNVCVRNVKLIDFNGLLGLIHHQGSFKPGSKDAMFVDLWVMNNGSWSRHLSVEAVPGVVKTLGVWENGEIFYQSANNNELVLVDPATKEVKNLGIANGVGGVNDFSYRMELIAYVESLVPINGRSEQDESEQDEQIIRRPPSK